MTSVSLTTAHAWTPETIIWQDIAPDGTKYALLEGNRCFGPFTYAFFLPAGFWDEAHWHSAAARVFVVSGSLHLGYGEQLHKPQAQAFGAGSVLLVPAEARHFDGAEEDTLIVGVASGPWFTRHVNPAHGASAGTVG
ncbi:cupin domain-containing protein [Deinococcus frigens]|uniref:cupin domain-containing protein n=1 Tax=Deinococcus frigens TaxID=249403 RepID=UPI000AC14C03|nr:cupin domain-containing protein [Deinococcus frigens]